MSPEDLKELKQILEGLYANLLDADKIGTTGIEKVRVIAIGSSFTLKALKIVDKYLREETRVS